MNDTQKIDLSPDSLLAEAEAQAKLSDFGPGNFREGLRVLVDTYEHCGLSPKGRKRTKRRLVQLLSNRLRIQEAFRTHPEIHARQIRQPVYLTGLPRTGTSALFNLLGKDAKSRPLLTWEGIFPDPLDGLEPGQEDPRLTALRDAYARDRPEGADFDKIHFVRADGPEECVLLQAHAFCDAQVGIEPLMSPYREWFPRQDLREMYSYYRDLLKLLDWQRPGERWLLKSPAHLWALDVLVEMFPDVCIIWTHRNPMHIIGSYCSMMEALMAMVRESFDRKALGATTLEFLARSLERGLEARDTSDPSRFIDVMYDDFVADPLATVRQIYAHFGLEMTPETAAALDAHVAKNPREAHGKHEYSLEQYGLTPDRVRMRLGEYIRRFGLPAEV
jgi:hypothetical protein